MDNKEILQRKLQSMFSDSAIRSKVVAELDRYGTGSHEREIDRVRLAILKNAGSNLNEIQVQVDTAKIDYRDVLSWAEYPNQINANTWMLSEEEKRPLIEKDIQQYEAWLKK